MTKRRHFELIVTGSSTGGGLDPLQKGFYELLWYFAPGLTQNLDWDAAAKVFFALHIFFLVALLVETRLLPPAGVSYVAPHLNNLYFLTLCQRYGVYRVIRWLFMLKLGLAVAMLLAGADHVYLLCIFIAR